MVTSLDARSMEIEDTIYFQSHCKIHIKKKCRTTSVTTGSTELLLDCKPRKMSLPEVSHGHSHDFALSNYKRLIALQ